MSAVSQTDPDRASQTQSDTVRHRQTQSDSDRPRRAQTDTDRHRQTQSGKHRRMQTDARRYGQSQTDTGDTERKYRQTLAIVCLRSSLPARQKLHRQNPSRSRMKSAKPGTRKATARGFEPLRAEPNGFLVHHLNHSVTLSCCQVARCVSVRGTGIRCPHEVSALCVRTRCPHGVPATGARIMCLHSVSDITEHHFE